MMCYHRGFITRNLNVECSSVNCYLLLSVSCKFMKSSNVSVATSAPSLRPQRGWTAWALAPGGTNPRRCL